MKSVATTSFPFLLLLIFITLRLCGVIHWSWWWVLAPGWIPFAIVLLLFTIGLTAVAFSKKREIGKK